MIRHLFFLILTLFPSSHLFSEEVLQGWKGQYSKTSFSGILLIKQFESFKACPYKDSNGLKTIGYGHVMTPLENHHLTFVSKKEAEELLRGDIKIAEQCVHQLISFSLTQNQFDALVSFVFNVGCGAFKVSHIYKNLKQKNFQKANLYWSRWVHDKQGILLQGLLKRREKEIELFNS